MITWGSGQYVVVCAMVVWGVRYLQEDLLARSHCDGYGNALDWEDEVQRWVRRGGDVAMRRW